jgi:molybdate transport system regulatory protein
MTLSARNQLSGDVSHVETNGVTAEVQIDLTDEETVTAVITDESIAELGIAADDSVNAVIKATDVMIATED